MANRKHLDVLQQRVKGWNAWREHHPDIDPDLREANLIRADLARVNLSKAMLRGANLRDANLGAANLYRTDLRETNLSGVDFRKARLSGANVSNAILSNTNFGDVDLSEVEGLEEVNHEGPSTIGIDTIYRSSGKVSSTFLRGAGVPENFITYMKSLVGQVFEYYSCFISYSTADQIFADRLHADLQAKNVRCWFAPHNIQGGRSIHEQIDEAIRHHDKLLLILSDHSMSSNWVKTEIADARAQEQHQKRQMLFPITLVPFESVRAWKCFDADSGLDSARVIREYFVPDFSRWEDPNSYQMAFDRLLRDLEANHAQAQEMMNVPNKMQHSQK